MEMHTDLQRLEAELGVKIYPGTEVLHDTEGVEFVKGSRGVLVPQPSADPEDPLNWSKFWKGAVTCNAILLGFMQGLGPLSISSQIPYYIVDFNTDVNGVINFIGVTILILGFSNFIWVPVATQFGRRHCALWSTVICLVSNIWRAKAVSYGSFLGACILNGIGAGPAETLPPIIIADTVFLNQRGTWMALYWFAYFGSLMVGPVIAGTISERWGWQSFWWLNTVLFGLEFFMILFFLPETLYKRDNTPTPGAFAAASDSREKVAVAIEHAEVAGGAVVERHVDDQLGRGRPGKWQLSVVPKFRGSKKSFISDILTPWYLFSFPIVEWSSFVVSWSSSCFLILNLTQSFVFAAPPYNFSPGAVGYTNLAVLGGAILGMATGGPGGDWIASFLTRRNKMIREPEMRLPALWPFTIILAIGSSIVAVGYSRQWSWKIIVILGYGAIGWQVAAIPALALAYAIDSYKPVSGEFLVSATVNKNLWGYGVSQFLIPWILKDGFIMPIMVNTGLTLFFTLFGSIVLFVCGKTVRGWSRNSFVHRM